MIKHIKLPYLLAVVSLLLPLRGGQNRPNVLMIAIDDMNDWVGAMGNHPDVQTPNMEYKFSIKPIDSDNSYR